MRDKNDALTMDLLLPNDNAARQRKFRQNMKSMGYSQKQVWVHNESFEAGYEARKKGASEDSYRGSDFDKKSWLLGYLSQES